MPHIAHEYPPYKLPSGAEAIEVLVDGAGCHWQKNAHGAWECVPRKGGDCDRKEWTDTGCRVELSIYGTATRFYIVKKCMCQNSIEDALGISPSKESAAGLT
jgi:hypothetical protein